MLDYRLEHKIISAIIFATKAHDGQRRKYTDEPYICHPLRVLALADKYLLYETYDAYIASRLAAVLHDTIEDTKVTYSDIENGFGVVVATIVDELTNVFTKENYPNYNRETRQQLEHERLANCSLIAKELKLCDRYDNILSRPKQKDGFMIRYKKETEHLLECLHLDNYLVELIKDELCHM